MDELKGKIQTLLDIEAIKNLRALYCYLVDGAIAGDKSRYDELVSRFVDDAWLDFNVFGYYEGKEAIAKFFREIVDPLWSYAAHMVMNPIIEVSGDQANGRWFVHALATTRESNRALWVQGRYDEQYVRVNGDWKWKSITFTPDFYTPFDEGWAKTKMMKLG
ncbi:MAG: nuclear transport factor 2 family protein [bacterium]